MKNKLLFIFVIHILLLTSISDKLFAISESVSPIEITCLIEDKKPKINNRIPLILIHGIHGNYRKDIKRDTIYDCEKNCNRDYWKSFLKYFYKNELEKKYKIYRFHYSSDILPIEMIGKGLFINVKRNKEISNKKSVILAHSMGGLVARSYMQEFNGSNNVDLLITLATPHHGSPLANNEPRFNMLKDPFWDILSKPLDVVAFGKHCKKCILNPDKPNRSGLRWDNYNSIWGNEYLKDKDERNDWLRKLNLDHSCDKKILAYYGYIGNDSEVEFWGNMGATKFHNYLVMNCDFLYNNRSTLLKTTGVLLERMLRSNNRIIGHNINFLNNDGIVPVISARFNNHDIKDRVGCKGFDHDDMKDEGVGYCTTKMTLFDSIKNDLMEWLNNIELKIECYDSEEVEKIVNDLDQGKIVQIEVTDKSNAFQCTDLVKHLRKDIYSTDTKNNKNLGLYAYDYYKNAANHNLDTGYEPVIGSILVFKKGTGRLRYGHVAIVTDFHSDKTFDIIEQNWKPEKVSTRENLTFNQSIMHGFIYDNPDKIECSTTGNGLSTALVLDRSGSMKGQKLLKAKQAANSYVEDMQEGDCCSVIGFSNTADIYELDKKKKTILCLESSGEQAKNLLEKKLSGTINDNISPGGKTNIAGGLEKGRLQLKNSRSKKGATLLLSDGRHNVGPFNNVLEEAKNYKKNGWKIFSVAFGKDANRKRLCEIAQMTDGACAPAAIENIVSVFQLMSNYAKDKTVLFNYNEYLRKDDTVRYEIPVDHESKVVTFYASWQGSSLDVQLTQPDGATIKPNDLRLPLGRFEIGKTHLLMEVNKPQKGIWEAQVNWKEPPPVGEQINLFVTEKTGIFANILPLENEYRLIQPVNIQVQADEVIGNKQAPLKNVSVNVEIKKPGPELIRMVEAQGQSFIMYKDVAQDVTREVAMFDDGSHQDYHPGDGIFGNVFQETDLNGGYLITAVVKGQKQNGETIERTLRASFQVGPISKNRVTNSQVINFLDQNKSQSSGQPDINLPLNESPSDQGDGGSQDPVQEIETMQKDDPLDNINKLLQGG